MAEFINPPWFPSISWFRRYLQHREVALSPLLNHAYAVQKTIIRGPNGLQELSIPLQKGPRHDMRELKPLNSFKWAKECRQAIKTAYGNAAFFEYYDYLLEPLFFQSYADLYTCNLEALKLICSWLKLPEPISAEGMPERLPSPETITSIEDYGQYFTERYPFTPEVGVLDVLFHCGPLGGLLLSGKEL
jgi:hypothetical protein